MSQEKRILSRSFQRINSPKMSDFVDEGNRTGTRNIIAEQASTSVTGKSHKQTFCHWGCWRCASGKTVVCNMIIEQLHDLRVVLVKQKMDKIVFAGPTFHP